MMDVNAFASLFIGSLRDTRHHFDFEVHIQVLPKSNLPTNDDIADSVSSIRKLRRKKDTLRCRRMR